MQSLAPRLNNVFMKFPMIARLFLCAVLLTNPIAAFAFETDQYNLPPQPLADIGDEVTQYVEQNVRKAVGKINNEIYVRQACLDKSAANSAKTKCNSPNRESERLDYLRSEKAVAREIYNLLGAGIPPFTKSGTWMDWHKFKKQPARYKTTFQDSIFITFPTNYLMISPTVNLYESHFGTDKIAHFFQQGYDYYKIYNRALAEGLAPDKAAERAVRWGQKTERTYFGTLISGVYSNADLCANYVGMKFYQGLTREIKIGDVTRPAVLLLKNGVWTFSETADLREILVKPFMTDHLDEARNSSVFTKELSSQVRRVVRKQSCRQWLSKFPNLSQIDFENASRALMRWHGEDYGFKESKKSVTIADTCFGSESKKQKAAEH